MPREEWQCENGLHIYDPHRCFEYRPGKSGGFWVLKDE